jgi:hypothetical protein
MKKLLIVVMLVMGYGMVYGADEWWKPYSPPCTERENVFEFTEKPKVRKVAEDRYEITFAVKGYCDVTVAIIDPDPKKELVPGRGIVVRHLGAGVLGPNAPLPFQKNSLKQTLYWDGKDDLGWYVKEPEKLKVRVSLGLKPQFDKRLGGTSPYNIPGRVVGMAAGPDGVYVLSMGRRLKFFIRKFSLTGEYIGSLVPPPANLPESRLGGMGFIEYEPGRRALHGTDIYQTVADHMRYPIGTVGPINETQPVVIGNRLYLATTGTYGVPSLLFWMYTDGSTELAGITGRPIRPSGRNGRSDVEHPSPRLCASKDGRWIYMTGFDAGNSLGHCVMRIDLAGKGFAEPWLGELKTPGSDEKHFNAPLGIATDAADHIYVADQANSRVQVFLPDGKLLKSISISRPFYVCVHHRTGCIYVQHETRVEGKSVRRTVKLKSLENPEQVAFVDGPIGMMALDMWSVKPRLWYANVPPSGMNALVQEAESGADIQVWEDEGSSFNKVLDFGEKMRQEDGEFHTGRWSGSGLGHKVVCDPTRETVLVENRRLFDLRSGRFLGTVKIPAYSYDDMAYDKHGRLHVHLNPGFDKPGVIRVDPASAQRSTERDAGVVLHYPEMPYDYGVEIPPTYGGPRRGGLPVKDQPGAKFFQDGIGVNMAGEIAEQCNIYYVPKMDDFARDFIEEMRAELPPGAGGKYGAYGGYAGLQRSIKDAEKRGEEVYSIKRQPGISLAGGTIWTFRRTGELWTECAVIAGGLINGTQIDEDGNLYFVAGAHGRTRFIAGKPFLSGCAGHYGSEERGTPFTGTLIKSKGQNLRILWNNSLVPLEPLPQRPPDLVDARFGETRTKGWVEGAAWLYAGASPIVATGCSCPTQRLHLDWYKRVYVPEQYRHSIGIVDTEGNLIMHLGKYGNFDSGNGPNSKIRVGDDDIAMSAVRFISGTDNYLVFDDGGERIVVLKLDYHSEAVCSIGEN